MYKHNEHFIPSQSFKPSGSFSAMLRFLRGKKKKEKKDSSDIEVYYNKFIQIPFNDIFGVLHPIFGQYYGNNDFIYMLSTAQHIFCAYDKRQGQCIACALINNDSTQGGLYIMLFGVRKSNQSHGTGTYLLETIIQWARQTGYRYIHLHVHVDNYKAIGLYEKVGFRKYQYLPNFYGNIQKDPPHAIQMILSL
jgi:ribosomal protein S18 acetylase RimI-like enzyme